MPHSFFVFFRKNDCDELKISLGWFSHFFPMNFLRFLMLDDSVRQRGII